MVRSLLPIIKNSKQAFRSLNSLKRCDVIALSARNRLINSVDFRFNKWLSADESSISEDEFLTVDLQRIFFICGVKSVLSEAVVRQLAFKLNISPGLFYQWYLLERGRAPATEYLPEDTEFIQNGAGDAEQFKVYLDSLSSVEDPQYDQALYFSRMLSAVFRQHHVQFLSLLREESVLAEVLLQQELPLLFLCAASVGNLRLLDWIVCRYPERLTSLFEAYAGASFYLAAVNGCLPVLEWLTARQFFELLDFDPVHLDAKPGTLSDSDLASISAANLLICSLQQAAIE